MGRISNKTDRDVAIIGIHGRFPQSDTNKQLWDNLHKGKSCIEEIPKDRWSEKDVDNIDNLEQCSGRLGGFIADVDKFDPLLFKVSPNDAAEMDPQQRLFLESVWSCLEDAGYGNHRQDPKNKIGLYVGSMWHEYSYYSHEFGYIQNRYGGPGSLTWAIANRTSFILNLYGPSIAIDTACSSSAMAVHLACQSILNAECDMAVAGGINLNLHPSKFEYLAHENLLASDPVKYCFKPDSEGYLPGEGVGSLLLKPLKKAIADGDHVYAVIKGTATNHNGGGMFFRTPDSGAQARLLQDAYSKTGIDPRTINYIEMAAFGSELTDGAEFTGLCKGFGKFTRDKGFCALGTLKPNLGHLEAASGISQIIKVLLQMKYRKLLPARFYEPVPEELNIESSPFYLQRECTDWEPLKLKTAGKTRVIPRRAGINSFGAGGTNVHLILEEYIPSESVNAAADELELEPERLFVFSANHRTSLDGYLKKIIEFIEEPDNKAGLSMSDMEYTLQVGREAMKVRAAFIACSPEDLSNKIEHYLKTGGTHGEVFHGEAKPQGKDVSDLEWVRNASLEELAVQWVKGSSINWQQRYETAERHRIPLPTYSFLRQSYWIYRKNELLQQSEPIEKTMTNAVKKGNESLEPVVEYLKQLFSRELGISYDQINETEAVWNYGLDSLAVKRLNKELEHKFGKITATLFFEYKTIGELAAYLSAQYPGLIKSSLKGDTIKEKTSPDSSGSEPEPVYSSLPLYPKTKSVQKSQDAEEPIAIIGVSGRYPMADSVTELWKNLKSGRDCVTEIPGERWDYRKWFHPDNPHMSYSKWGGFINDFDKFDPMFFNITPREAELMDPQERLLLQTVWEAIEDSGYTGRKLGRTSGSAAAPVGVFVGVMWSEYQLFGVEETLKGNLITPSSAFWSIPNRVSYFFNYSGPSIAVDTACSSSLTAVHLACESLRRNECTAAIAGGISLSMHPSKYLYLSHRKFASSEGKCRTFGEGGDGYVPGEGVGAIILKPLSKAAADGDHIYGIIRSSVISHGGKTNGYTVPSPRAQAEVIKTAMKKAGIDPRTIGYVEAHGTGTALGDPIEIEGLTQAFGSMTEERQYCAIGSLKSNIGHCESAAGIAGVTKVLLQLKYGQLAPSLHSEVLNSNIDFTGTPFTVQQELTEWKCRKVEINGKLKEYPRRACVSSFGAGGANAHVIIEEYISNEGQRPSVTINTQNPAVIVLSAKNEEQLKELAQRMLTAIEEQQISDINLADVAYTLQTGREVMEERLAVIAAPVAQLEEKLKGFVEGHDKIKDLYKGQVKRSAEIADFFSEDEELQEAVDKWILRKKYGKLMELWVKGLDVDWSMLYGDAAPHRISLPTYPFAKERYWVPELKTGALSSSLGNGTAAHIHPLIHENTSDFSGQRFSSTFTGREFFISRHTESGQKVLPGAVYLEMVRAAVEHSAGNLTEGKKTILLENVVMAQFVRLTDNPHKINIVLYPRDVDRYLFEIYSTLREDGTEDTIHAQGAVVLQAVSSMPPPDVESVKSRCSKTVLTAGQFYETLSSIGIDVSTEYRGVREVYSRDGEALARLSLPASVSDSGEDFVLHPVIMDSVMQASIWLLNTQDSFRPAEPFSLEHLGIYKNCPPEMWVSIRSDSSGIEDNSNNKLEITLLDNEGKVCVSLNGLEFNYINKDNTMYNYQSSNTAGEQAEAADVTAAEADTSASIEHLKKLISEITKIPENRLDSEAHFEELGLDSITISSLNQKVEQWVGEADATLFFKYKSIHDLGNYLAETYPKRISETVKKTTASRPVQTSRPIIKRDIPKLVSLRSSEQLKRQTFSIGSNYPSDTDIAIIGVSGRFPKAETLEHFWRNLHEGMDCIDEIPQNRWSMEGFFEPDRSKAVAKGLSYSKWGGFLKDIDCFDPLFFNISPREAMVMDPQERLFLETAWECIEDAGYTRRSLKEKEGGNHIGVFAGVSFNSYQLLMSEAALKANRDMYSVNSQTFSVANRISYVMNFTGPSLSVDTACSSSLYAIHLACEAIRSGQTRMAIAGGVNLSLHPSKYIMLSQGQFSASDGRCRAFSEGGTGYVSSEGVGAVFLKPLKDAEADGDIIYGVIKGTAANHGGKTNGFTVPNPVSQAMVIEQALLRSNIDPRSVSFIEAHGTGTALGDPIEITGLTDAFRKYTEDTAFCKISSVKSNIGHAEAAAGIAQLVKVLLQFKYRTLVRNVPHGNGLNRNIDFTKTPFVVQEKTERWERPVINGQEVPRRAGVSSFGAGGSNAHVVLEEYIAEKRKQIEVSVDPLIIVLSAKSGEQLREQAKRLLDYIVEKEFKDSDLASIAYTLQVGRETMEERFATVTNSITELKSVLKDFAEGKESMPNLYRGQVRSNNEALAAFTADEDMENTIKAWIVKGKYEKITDLWVKGMSFDWNRLYGEIKPQRISLPTYPFLKERYWIPDFVSEGSDLNGGLNNTKHQFYGETRVDSFIHPLIHVNTSDFIEQRYSSVFTGREFFLKDHIVKGQKVLPGVAYLEMAREAVRQAVGKAMGSNAEIHLRDVVWTRPIVAADSRLKVNIALFPEDNGEIVYEIYTGDEGENGEVVACSQGRAVPAGTSEAVNLDIDSMKVRCSGEYVTSDMCYDVFKTMGLDYGEGHRGIENIYKGKDCLLAKLCIPDCVRDTLDNFVLHPGLTDSALQASLMLTVNTDENAASKPALPFALEELAVYDSCSDEMWAYICYSNGSSPENRVLKVDIDLCDRKGRVCVQFRGLSSRVLEGEMETGSEDTGTLLAEPYWRETGTGNNDGEINYEEHLVFLCEDDSISSSLLKDNKYGIRYIPLICEEGGPDKRFENYAVQVFNEIKGVLGKKHKGKVLIQVVVPLYNENRIFEGISGLMKTARLENSKLICQLIQLEQYGNPIKLIEILKYNSASPEDIEIRYQSGKRYVLGWRELKPSKEEGDVPWKDNGVYLITGGTGGLGLIFAHDIAQRAKGTKIILSGRASLSKEKECCLNVHGADVTYRQVDVTDGNAVNDLIKGILAEYGRINGIIHGAGVIHDNFIIKKTEAEFRDVLAPKVTGLVNLDRASRDMELDFFILFSSTAGSFGNPGQADYTAANTFMDAYAAHYNARLKEKGKKGRMLSLGWPLWKDGGMRVDVQTENMMLESTGMMPISTVSGIQALYKSLKYGSTRIAVLEGKTAQIRRKLLKADDSPNGQFMSNALINMKTDLKHDTEESLLQIISELLAVKTKEIDTEAGWEENGFEQFRLARFADILNERFNTELSVTRLSEYRNLKSLIEFLQLRNDDTFEETAVSDEEQIISPVKEKVSLVTDELLFQKTVDYLKNEVASVIKLSPDRIEADASMEKYGIDSVLSMQLVNQLEKTFGSLSKTLFFEYQTVRELTAYFVDAYKDKLMEILRVGKHEEKETEEVIKPVVSEDTFNISTNNFRRSRFKLQFNQAKDEKTSGALDIAIIGLAGRYPQADDVAEFWDNLKNGKDCITEIPEDRWDYKLYFDEDKNKKGKTYSKWGGFINGVDEFDPLFFNISPREAETMDPQERLFLECVYSAVEDAGYTRDSLASYQGFSLGGNVGVFVGVMYEEYQLFGAQSTALGKPFALTGYPGSIANRVSYFFNFHGPSMAVDTLCSSSLTAINLACRSLLQGECKAAIAGGVNVSIHPNKYLLLAQGKFASSKGRCESFGQGGDGYVPGEGVGAILLKPLSKAIEDNDQIYGVIKAVSLNHGGKTNGYTVPNPNAQADVIGQAYKTAGVNPETISYIEAHGTGTSLGDPIEIAGLNKAFGDYTRKKQFCAIGSAKSNIGHCESAAGIAAVTKVLLQMKYKQLVPSIHSRTLNPYIDFENSPFVVQQEFTEWKRPVVEIDGEVKEYPRIAGISSFGAGGANAHVVIEEYIPEGDERSTENNTKDTVIIVLSAKNRDRLNERVRLMLTAIKKGQLRSIAIADVAYTLQLGREAMEERLAVLVKSYAELEEKLSSFIEGKNNIDNLFYGDIKSNSDVLTVWKEDDDLNNTIDMWIGKGKYSKLSDMWVKGLNFDWDKLYDGVKHKRVSLPTYPFTREHYWVQKVEDIKTYSTKEDTLTVAGIYPLLHQNTSTDNEQWFDIDLCDEKGNVCIRLRGFETGINEETVTELPAVEYQRRALPSKTEEDNEIIAFEEVWEKEALTDTDPVEMKTVVCFLSGKESRQEAADTLQSLSNGIKVVLISRGAAYEKQSPEGYVVKEDQPCTYMEAFKSIRNDFGEVDGIFCLWPLDDKELIYNYSFIFNIIKAISITGLKPKRFILAARFQEGLERCYMESWIGFERSLRMVMSGTQISLVCAGPGFGKNGTSVEEWLRVLWDESNAAKVRSVLYQGTERFVSRIKPSEIEAGINLLKNGGTYLITGGLGGLGFIFAEHLAKTRSANLVLVGRSSLDNLKQAAIKKLEGIGSRVLYVQADICDSNSMKEGLKKAKGLFGDIHGVIHSAGLAASSETIAEKDLNSFIKVLEPKVEGTLELDELLKDEPLDFICYFSSSSAVLGDFGSCDYSVGNRFQMAYAHYRNSRQKQGEVSGKAFTINWPLWKDGGMGFEDDSNTEMYLKTSGQCLLETDKGIDIFEKILSQENTQYLIMAGQPARINRFLGLGREKQTLTAPVSVRTPAKGRRVEVKGLSVEQCVEWELKEQVSAILKVPREKLDTHENLADFGFDSISLAEFAAQLTKHYGIEITPALFFGYPTVEKLKEYFLKEHNEAINEFYKEDIIEETPAIKPVVSTVKNAAAVQQSTGSRFRGLSGFNSLKGLLNKQTFLGDLDKGAEAGGTGAGLNVNQGIEEPIAVIGMSGRFPGARNIDEMWEVIDQGRSVVGEMPIERFDWRQYYGDPGREPEKVDIKCCCGCIPGVDEFDPLFFEISPKEAVNTDPKQRLLLQEAYKALEDAGYGEGRIRNSVIGMFVGVEDSDYDTLTDGRAGITSNHNGVLAARLSYFLNLSGPNMAINTACSSGLVAVHQACQSIRNKECDTAIAAGVSLMLTPNMYLGMAKAGMLSKDGICYTFDKRANGMVPGEAVAAVVLKSLSKAEADGDPIYAVIKGSGINYDGKTNGITAPSGVSQTNLLKSVYNRYKVNPEEIEYIVTHGTGTKLGDPIEINALYDAFKEHTQKQGYCALTSTKTNFGHALAASGVVSLISMVQAFRHDIIPASLNCDQVNDYINWNESPFYVNKTKKAWPGEDGKVRTGAVSAFGMSGTNAHVVLQSYDKKDSSIEERAPYYLLALSAKTQEALTERIRDMIALLESKDAHMQDLYAISYTLLEGRQHYECRLAAVVQDREAALYILKQAENKEKLPNLFKGNISRDFKEQEVLKQYIREQLKKIGSLRDDREKYKEILYALADMYSQGYEIEWDRLFGSNKPRRVNLPAYPFAREHYWVSGKEAKPHAGGIKTATPAFHIHPLLHQNTSDFSEQRFTSIFTGQEFFLRDHVVRGRHILPGVAYLEMVREAIMQAAGLDGDSKTSVSIRDMVWSRPIVVKDSQLKVSISLFPENNGEAAFEIYRDMRNGNNRSEVSGSGRVLINSYSEVPSLDIKSLRAMCCQGSISSDDCYRAFSDMGLDYGGGHRGIDRLYIGKDCVLAKLCLPDCVQDTIGEFFLHPGLADSALQASIGLNMIMDKSMGKDGISTAKPSIPFAIEELGIIDRCCTDMWAFVRYSEGFGAEDKIQKLDIDLSDGNGRVCVQFKRYSSRAPEDEVNYEKTSGDNMTLMMEHYRKEMANQRNIEELNYDEQILMQIISELLGVKEEDIEPAAYWEENGFDQYRLARLADILSEKYKTEITVPGLLECGNLESLFKFLTTKYHDTSKIKETKMVSSVEEKGEVQIQVQAQDVSDHLLLEKTISYLKNEVSPVIGMSAHRIEADAPMEKYGIDSILSLQLVNQLEKTFGSLSKTLFFEYQNLRDLSIYFIENYKESLIKVLGISGNEGTAEKENEKSVMQEEPVKVVNSNIKSRRFESFQNRINKEKTASGLDIAIIGLAGRYPQAKDIGEYWRNLCSGKDCITEIPADRWDHSLYFDENKDSQGKTYSKWGGFIDGVDRFDPVFFNITPREAEFMDPQERLFLECVYSAMEDAGYTREVSSIGKMAGVEGNVGVFVGVMYEEYQLYGAMGTAVGKPFALPGNPASIANRVSYFFNFNGPSMAVDTMCSSSLTAIHLACRSLLYDGCEMAVAGGVNVSIHPNKYLLLAQGRFASSKGRCESFGQGGDGYVPGEGVGAVILKPLSKAIEDGDHIYGVIKGSALNHGGKTNGYTVPNPNAQAEVIGRSFKGAGINPKAISYIEAHGTGTSLGDPIEITALSKAFRKYTQEKQFCSIGSAKSNIGHCESAAGIAGVTKILLQMKYRQLVPSLHSQILNPYIDFENSPFIVQQELSEWKRPVIEIDGVKKECPRIAGISSFGAGGSNAHVVIEEYVEKGMESRTTNNIPNDMTIIILSAKNGDRLKERANQLLAVLREGNLSNLVDLSYTLQIGREAMEERLGLLVRTFEELEKKLEDFLEGKINIDGLYYGQVKNNKEVLALWKDDEDLRGAVNALISKGKLTRIVELWVKGFNFDWNELYRDNKPRRISLPTYPFTEERCWFSNDVKQSDITFNQAPNRGKFNEALYNQLIEDVMSDNISTETAARDIRNMYLKRNGNTDVGRR